uniref:DUF4220 domain-containing protein n=1 Tax=Hordeum vulgare subsp. vulgare TaxID=112509 RepID=A0A8I6YY41_HORVV
MLVPVSRAAAAMYNSSAASPGRPLSIVFNITVGCATPGVVMVESFTVSPDMRTTERLMVTTTVLMTLLGAALFFLGVSGRLSGRGRGHSAATRIFFRASFALFLPFMSYMFSQAKSKGNQPRAQLILLWMLIAELLRKKVYAMVAPAGPAFTRGVARYSSFDAVEEAASMAWIGYLVYAYVHDGVKPFFIILWIFSVAKMCKRAICIHLAKRSFDLAKNAALVSGYMAQLVRARRQVFSDNNQYALGANIMRTCNYLVMGESRLEREVTPHGFEICDQEMKNILSDDSPDEDQVVQSKTELIRVCNIWDLADNDHIFRYNQSSRRKLEHICLALALFKLLRRKVEKFHMAEAETTQARDLVLGGLLALEDGRDEAADAERAFEVVELELRFLDEYYQAIIPLALPNPGLFIANFVFSIVFILLYCITVLLVTGNGHIFKVLGSLFKGLIDLSIDMVVQYKCFSHQMSFLFNMVCSSSDLIVTFLLTLTLLAVEAYEFVQYLLSDWFIASLLCNYARKQQPVRKQLVKGTLWAKHRSRPVIKVHQVTMLKLHQLHPRRVWMLVSHLLKRRLVGLPDAIVVVDAKMAIVRVLKDVLTPNHGRRFSNGIAALGRHGFTHLEWACDDKLGGAGTVTMVWHIATTLFETRDRQKHPLPPYGQAALTLSRYCAYLVAYEPGLLPDDVAWTEKVYKDIKEELNTFFKNCFTTTQRRKRLMMLCPTLTEKEEKSSMAKGIKLGKQLENGASGGGNAMREDEKGRRRAQALANGGEFITHIWAMLTHAGVQVPKDHQEDQAPTSGHPV